MKKKEPPPATALPKPCLCPACGSLLEASTPMEGDATPAPGDVTMCLPCGVILIYTADMMVRVAMAEDIASFPRELMVHLLAMQLAQRVVRERFPRKPEASC